jgi:hypothetical protein
MSQGNISAVAEARGPECKGPGIQIKLGVKAYAPCPIHAPAPCECEKVLTGEVVKDHDLATKQFAQFVMALLLNSTQTINDTTATGRSVANASATTAPTILAGTTATAATVTDTALGAQTETQSGTVNAYSGSGSSGSFTVTGTITAGADRAYTEVGLRVTNGGNTFLICRDTFSTLNVSSSGTLAVTYTLTFS